MPALVTGQFEFVHNVRVPGHAARPRGAAAERRAPRWRAWTRRSVRGMPGVVKVVVKNNFVGVVAEKPWQAVQAAAKLRGDVDARPAARRPSATPTQDIRKQPARDTLLVDSGDVDATLAPAATVLRATYRHPYQMHGSVGSSCAVADVQADTATLWSATQSALPDAQHDGDAARAEARDACA